jgi:hypothetical protein
MYKQIITNAENENFRFDFVRNFIVAQERNSRILDIGSGTKPFKKIALDSGLHYVSHDFEKYFGKTEAPGL